MLHRSNILVESFFNKHGVVFYDWLTVVKITSLNGDGIRILTL